MSSHSQLAGEIVRQKMTTITDIRELKARIIVFGVGGAGGNAVNNMITSGLHGVEFIVANTDAQALTMSRAERIIQMGAQVTQGLGAGSQPEVGRAAAEEAINVIRDQLSDTNIMMGRGEASGAKRVLNAAVAAISNPLIEDPSIKRASGLIISIAGGKDLMLFEVDEAASRIREEVDEDANIIIGATFDESLEGIVRVSVVATGIDNLGATHQTQPAGSLTELAGRPRNDSHRSAEPIEHTAPRPQLRTPVLPPTIRHPEGLPAKPIPEYARPAAPRSLAHGRFSAVRNSIEQAVLDIPAFLGRKAN